MIGLLHDIEELSSVDTLRTLEATPGSVDLWLYDYGTEQDQRRYEAELDLLSPDELARHDRLRFDHSRRMFTATRALARTTLSRYVDRDPREWRFEIDRHGKPYLASTEPGPGLWFNLTNTRGAVACVVSVAHSRIGVDIEHLGRQTDLLALAKRYFATPEVEDLRCRDPATRLRRFFTYWTLKESYIKAVGVGVSLGLGRFWFSVGDDGIGVDFAEDLDDDPGRWQFALIEPLHDYLLAVGVDTGTSPLFLAATKAIPIS